MSDETRREIGADVQEAADRLNRLVENLLDMSRLDSGQLHIKRDWCDICELLGSAVNRMKKRLNGRPVSIACAPGLPLISLDFVLIEQAIVNLIDNACAYTPPGAPITLAAHVEENKMYLTIEDRGPGIPTQELDRVFDKFYRIEGTATGGTGLGLSITEGVVKAHAGTIRVENALQGGARFIITLPLNDKAPQVREADL
jgi:two-component system sensor histidine kinase KdpD